MQIHELAGPAARDRVEPTPALSHDESRYLAALNSCFGEWGDETVFDWCFRRPGAGLVADKFVMADNGEWIAGSAVSWRTLVDAGGTERLVGIMTGSWTLPAARRRGCFQAMIDFSRELCARRGADWLLAFVTQDNGSRRQLERAGSLMIPTDYLWSLPDATPPAPETEPLPAEPSPDLLATLWRRRAAVGDGHIRFLYDDLSDWVDQLVERPLPVDLLRVEGSGDVLVERHAVFDRIMATIPLAPDLRLPLARAVWARALQAGRRFFAFGSRPDEAAALRHACDLGGTTGFITVLPVSSSAPDSTMPWLAESGERA